ncbi:MAG: VanZ family protein [Fimbriimonadaceae bacterium]|nr:VanZ family protein [Fimbriimonadaceae bacterium]QYK54794.1 MAG: VanZ family protein [Fimbriimonadaceae bacterium]
MATLAVPVAPFALPLALGLAVTAYWRRVTKPWPWAALFYAGALFGGWAFGSRENLQVPMPLAFLIAGTLCCLTLLWLVFRSGPRSGWLLLAVLVGLSLAVISGPEGGPGRFMYFLTQILHLSEPVAGTINLVVRKALHFTAYGIFAYSAARGAAGAGTSVAKSVPLGLAWALSHAVFDEMNQGFAPNRSGSPYDVLLDTAGMATLLTVYLRANGLSWRDVAWPWKR